MPYCAAADLLLTLSSQKLTELTDDANTGSYNEDKVSAAIEAAQTEIDGYLRGRLPLPLDPVPPLIKDIACALAKYQLYRLRFAEACPQTVRDDYKDAVSKLEKIQSGRISVNADDAARGPGSYRTNKRPADRLFGKARLEEY